MKKKFKNGKLMTWIKTKGKNTLGKTLDIIGEFTGKEAIEKIGESLMNDPELTPEEKKEASELVKLELELETIREQEVSNRWKADMMSDSWLSKNIRPLVVINITLMFDALIICAFTGINLLGNYIALFTTVLVTVYGGYFTLRTVEKRNKKKYL
jgi:hypothetical protein